ncbi:MAG: hypothetical protein PHZ26_02755 [Candidatus Gracilibacteria bacterium]|nr:hypothetical protein [Candidatus Gracilibacteria bacterium]MDD2908652.1 hypothetical protein [Candidatus Gracilibacteria bacterium]
MKNNDNFTINEARKISKDFMLNQAEILKIDLINDKIKFEKQKLAHV